MSSAICKYLYIFSTLLTFYCIFVSVLISESLYTYIVYFTIIPRALVGRGVLCRTGYNHLVIIRQAGEWPPEQWLLKKRPQIMDKPSLLFLYKQNNLIRTVTIIL